MSDGQEMESILARLDRLEHLQQNKFQIPYTIRVPRIILSLALIAGVYTETGPWTSLFALLLFTNAEFVGYAFSKR